MEVTSTTAPRRYYVPWASVTPFVPCCSRLVQPARVSVWPPSARAGAQPHHDGQLRYGRHASEALPSDRQGWARNRWGMHACAPRAPHGCCMYGSYWCLGTACRDYCPSACGCALDIFRKGAHEPYLERLRVRMSHI